MSVLSTFLAPGNRRTAWGVVDAAHPTPHRGQDIAVAAGGPEYAIRPGSVALLGQATALGYYTVVLTAYGWDYYCHQKLGSRLPVGTKVASGDLIGLAAGSSDVHGTAWTGPHLHYGSGPYPTSVTTGATYDATAIVQQVYATVAPAGSGGTPINNNPPPSIPIMPLEEQMLIRNTARGDFILESGKVQTSPNPGVFDRLKAGGAVVIPILDEDIDAVVAAFAGPSWTVALYPPVKTAFLWVAPESKSTGGGGGGATAAQIDTVLAPRFASVEEGITAVGNEVLGVGAQITKLPKYDITRQA